MTNTLYWITKHYDINRYWELIPIIKCHKEKPHPVLKVYSD